MNVIDVSPLNHKRLNSGGMKMVDLKKRKAQHLTGVVLLFLFIIALSLFSSPARADDIVKTVESLEKELPKEELKVEDEIQEEEFNYEEHKDWIIKFKEAAAFLKKYGNVFQPLNLSVAAGYYGHKSGDSNLYNLSIDTSINYNVYPNAFRFTAGTSIQYRDNELLENVTTLLMSYDHHIKPWLEIYGFVERFSDSYLSIKERYEIGCGLKLELDLLNAKKKKALKKYKRNASSYQEYRKILKNLGKPDHVAETMSANLEYLEKPETTEMVEQAVKKKYTKMSAGLALSLFSELEHAEIGAAIMKEIDNRMVEESESFLLEAEHRFRLVLRPSLLFRPIDELTFRGLVYFKCPVGRPYKVNEKFDMRLDGLFRIEYKLTAVPGWAKSVSLVLEYQRHYDNLPPGLSQAILDEYTVVGNIFARNTHDEFSFKLSFLF